MGPVGCYGRCRMGIRKMAWNWCFWRREETAESGGRMRAESNVETVVGKSAFVGIVPDPVEAWEARLVEAGVSSEWARRLAERLASSDSSFELSPDDSLARGAALAFEMQADVLTDVERKMRDVGEVERLLGAFSGELEKLDEVLEVLSAFAQKMRSKPAEAGKARSRRVLH